MTVLRLHMLPSPFLRHKAVTVQKSYLRDSPYLKTLTANMAETMSRLNGVGLAGPFNFLYSTPSPQGVLQCP